MLTVGYSLKIEIALYIRQIRTHPFEINLILNVGHQDESCNHTLSTAAFNIGRNFAVPDIVSARKQSTDTVFRHSQDDISVFELGRSRIFPIRGRCIPQILSIWHCFLEIRPVESSILTYGLGSTDIQRIGHEWITSTKAVGARYTYSLSTAWVLLRAQL